MVKCLNCLAEKVNTKDNALSEGQALQRDWSGCSPDETGYPKIVHRVPKSIWEM